MSASQVVSATICLVAVFGYLNHRFIKLPDAVGITAFGVVVSIAISLLGRIDADIAREVQRTVGHIDFSAVVLHGLLGPLLFAGSLQISVEDVAKEKWLILSLSTVGVLLSTSLVGGGFFAATHLVGLDIPFFYCLLFGALISPTDPVAVLAVLKRVGLPKGLETRIVGESLVNDGTGVVVFLTLFELALGGRDVSFSSTAALFTVEVLGGTLFGIVVGHLGVWMLRGIVGLPVEILITLALATGGFALADAIHVSAPIAVVLMGLIVGNRGRREAMTPETRWRLFDFWEVVDELLNLILFGLIGVVMMTLSFSKTHALIGGITIVVVLAARLLSISGPILATPRLRAHSKATITIMTWGGLRGGLSIALALALPAFAGREAVIYATYAVVIFSILIQAPSLQRVAARVRGTPLD